MAALSVANPIPVINAVVTDGEFVAEKDAEKVKGRY